MSGLHPQGGALVIPRHRRRDIVLALFIRSSFCPSVRFDTIHSITNVVLIWLLLQICGGTKWSVAVGFVLNTVFRRKKLVIRLANAGGLAGWLAGWLAGGLAGWRAGGISLSGP
ncbi:hypothetical protein DPMN_123034 [Dreissena polymorpha]|uniref:Uncharacterized protein n=1 Tax=Dreissena polymorpha TaxID=45954 RepID=A0A9D4JR46_DREPO|nr:hypothetical protein DPMN_123034 [Dreissena polymorpha]